MLNHSFKLAWKTLSLYLACLFTCFVTFAELSRAQSSDEKISIPFNVSAATNFTVTILKERKDTKDGLTTRHFKSKSNYAGTIDDVNETGTLITWQLTGFEVEEIVAPVKKPPVDMDNVAKEFNFPIQFEADPFGRPLRIIERGKLQEKLLALTQRMGGKSADGFAGFLKGTFFTLPDDQFAQSILQEAQVLAQGQMMELPREGYVESSDQVPSPLGGPPVTYVSKVRFLEETNENVVFELNAELEPDSVRKNVAEVVERIAKQTGRPFDVLQKEMSKTQVVRRDKIVYRVSKESGWTSQVHVTKLIESTAGEKVQSRADNWDISVQVQQ